MNSAEVWELLCLAWISTAARKQDEVDWCIEDEDAASVPARGVLNVAYRGRFGTGAVSIEPFVKTDPSGVVIAACLEGQQYRVMDGLFVSGLATVRAYDAQTGRFVSETRVTNGLQEEITLDVDLEWARPTP